MPQQSRTTVRRDTADDLFDRLRSQFPELSHDEVVRAAAGTAALPGHEPVRRDVGAAAAAPPRHRA